MRIKASILAGLMALPVILTLLAFAVVGAFAGAFLGWKIAAASLALGIAAIGLVLASISLSLHACGVWLGGIFNNLDALYKQGERPPQQSSTASQKPN